MKKWLAIVGFCVFLIPCAYGETINYDGGGKYVGEVSNGVPHGQGTYTFPDGPKYVGEYKDGQKHGQGTYTWSNGGKYVGEWKDNKPWHGTMYNNDGTVRGRYAEGVYQ